MEESRMMPSTTVSSTPNRLIFSEPYEISVARLATDISYGSEKISRFGVEETVVDGIILLSSIRVGLDRERSLDVYKLRATARRRVRQRMRMAHGGPNV